MTALGKFKRSGRALFSGKKAVQNQQELKKFYREQGYSKKQARQYAIHDVNVDKAKEDKKKKDKAKLQKKIKNLKPSKLQQIRAIGKSVLNRRKSNLQPHWPGFAESD
tara:strand:- start:332 stop:655 length:324 start_codon:yes stop_codon:yes gene_type:complete